MTKNLSASMEDYLEAIYNIVNEKKVARVRDIAQRMDVTMPAVTNALRSLNAKEYINYTPYEYVELTEKGKKVANKIVNRHEIIKEFLEKVLDIPSEQASENACRIEHVIDDIILERLASLIEIIENCPNSQSHFEYFYSEDRSE